MTSGTRLGAILGASTAAALLFFLGQAAGAPGDLDPTFGTDGVAQTAIGTWGAGASTLLVQPDGKIVLGGWRDVHATLARYLPDGGLDPSFGLGGIAKGPQLQGVMGSALQNDGKILLAGPGPTFRFTVLRFNANGTLDTSFGAGGIATGPAGDAYGVAVQEDGGVVVAGSGSNGPAFELARFRPDGVLDATFGTAGVVRTPVGAASYAHAVLVQRDGKIVAAGESEPDAHLQNVVVALARYLPDGRLDPAFGSGGISTAEIGSRAYAASVALAPGGKIVAAGTSDQQIAIAGFLPDGRLDLSFAVDGTVTLDAGTYGYGTDVTVASDGRIVVTGWGSRGSLLARYEPDGSLDAGFGADGIVTTDDELLSGAEAVALQPDDRILAAGGGYGGFAVARYLVTTPSSISGQPLVVDYGKRVQLSGTLTSRQAATVDVLHQACLESRRTTSTTTFAGADGTWSASVSPRSRTVYWAGVGLERSSSLTVQVRPRLTLKRVGPGVLRARALFGRSLAGEGVVLQRRSNAKGWVFLRYQTLARIATGRAGVVSGATFRVARQPSRRLRLVLPQEGVDDCFAGSTSKPIRG